MVQVTNTSIGWINPAWAKVKGGSSYEHWYWEYNGEDLFKA